MKSSRRRRIVFCFWNTPSAKGSWYDAGGPPLTAFDRRTQADYHAMLHFRLEDVSELLDQARRFVAEMKSLLQTT